MNHYFMVCCAIAVLPVVTLVAFYLVTAVIWATILTLLVIFPAVSGQPLLWLATVPAALFMITQAMEWLQTSGMAHNIANNNDIQNDTISVLPV